MQFSESWLRSLCNPALSNEELCHLLTMAGLEVEENEPVAPEFAGVVVAHVLSVEKHPDADKLKLCSVDQFQDFEFTNNGMTMGGVYGKYRFGQQPGKQNSKTT